jgi:MscS family membrane protein
MKKLLALVLLAIILAPAITAELIPTHEEIEIGRGERTNVGFTVVNERNETVFFTVSFSYVKDWYINVTPQSGVIFGHASKIVNVEIRAPETYGNKEFDLEMEIRMYNKSGYIGSYFYNLHIIYISQSKFLFFFDISWPASIGYWGDFLNVVLTWLVITAILYFLFPLIKRVTKFTKNKLDDILLEILKRPVPIWVIAYGVTDATLTLPFLSDYYDLVIIFYNVIVVIIITWISYRFFREVIIRYMLNLSKNKGGDLDSVLIPILEKLGIVLIGTLGGLMVLQVMGINVGVLVASLGIAVIILGLAAQQTLGNFFSGIHILLDKAFKIGDTIMLEGDEGVYKVLDVGIRSTRLYEVFSNTVVFVPNSILASKKIINLNKPNNRMKIQISVGVSYDSDVHKVMRVLRDIAYSNPYVLKGGEFEPVVVFSDFGNSSLNFNMYVWVGDVMEQWGVASMLRQQIIDRFREEGIEIPYQKVDVYIKQPAGKVK